MKVGCPGKLYLMANSWKPTKITSAALDKSFVAKLRIIIRNNNKKINKSPSR